MEYHIPTWSPSRQWHYTDFASQEEFRDFLIPLFKEPGELEFDETSRQFTLQAQKFMESGMYCEYTDTSDAYAKYWNTEKEKCRKGVIYHNDKGNTWYLPRFYYHWLNFLQIYDKRKRMKKAAFPEFRDVQYYMSMYECLAELHELNGVTLKRRQVASTYLHDAMLFNRYIFEEQFKGKIGASDKKYIEGANGAWRFLDDYLNFTNTNTAWIRYNDPSKVGTWIQRTKASSINNRGEKEDSYVGNFSSIAAVTFDKDPASGVGGANDLFYYEEGGIAPTADQTLGYMREAQSEGSEVTGYFTIAGSVGSLEQCKPLMDFMLHPERNGFFPVQSRHLDETGNVNTTGLFIPIYWGYSGEGNNNFIDQYGNSLVKEAKEYIDKKYAAEKAKKDHAAYQLLISQGPRTIMEAFGVRSESIFPLRYTAKQAQAIEDKEYWCKNVTLERSPDNTILIKDSDRPPNVFPFDKTIADRRGCVVIHEKPIEATPQWLTYFGSVDPVEVGKTKDSDSLAHCCIWKNAVEVHRTNSNGESEIFMEGGKLVAEYWGRYDDVNDTNEMISMLVELYNAWTICENNKNSWINHMRIKKRHKYLVRKGEMLFDKEMKITQNDNQEYGWTKTVAVWEKMLEYGIDSLSEVTYHEYNSEGEITKTHYGHERIGPFIGIIKEMQSYSDKGNFDHLVGYCSLMTFIQIQRALGRTRKRIERTDKGNDEYNKQMRDLIYNKSPFHNIGRTIANKWGSAYDAIRKKPFR